MPKGPQGQKRPADVIGNAVLVAKIATGEEEDTKSLPQDLREYGRSGGKARARALSPEKRTAIAQKAAAARWKNDS